MPFNLLYVDTGELMGGQLQPVVRRFTLKLLADQEHKREEGLNMFTGCEFGPLTYKLCAVPLKLNKAATCSYGELSVQM